MRGPDGEGLERTDREIEIDRELLREEPIGDAEGRVASSWWMVPAPELAGEAVDDPNAVPSVLVGPREAARRYRDLWIAALELANRYELDALKLREELASAYRERDQLVTLARGTARNLVRATAGLSESTPEVEVGPRIPATGQRSAS